MSQSIRSWDVGGFSHPGTRPSNQDAFLLNESQGLFVLADGVGGHQSGEVAAELTCQIVNQRVLAGESLTQSIEAAHQTVRQSSLDQHNNMASTVVAVQCLAEKEELKICLAWVGDSRAYLASPDGLWLLTEDHTHVRTLYREGRLSHAELLQHPDRHILNQAIGMADGEPLVSLNQGYLTGRETLIICSDGVSDILDGETMLSVLLSRKSSAQTLAEALVRSAVSAGTRDNATCICVRLGSSSAETAVGRRWDRVIEQYDRQQSQFLPVEKEMTVGANTNSGHALKKAGARDFLWGAMAGTLLLALFATVLWLAP